MSSLLLIRHGQASLHGADYDVLSEIGWRQARRAGEAMAGWGVGIDALYTGPRRRHLDTTAALRKAAAEGGLELPEPTVVGELDEIDVAALTGQALQRVLPSCPGMLDELSTGSPSDAARTASNHLKGVLGKLLERWIGGEAFDGIEPYQGFSERIHRGLTHIMRTERRGRRVAVVTSGGPISVATRLALGLPPAGVAKLMFALVNASFTELQYREDRLGLSSFNAYGHLLPPSGGLVTKM